MSQKENTNWRDKYFPSKWHRAPNLPENFYLIDIDAVELRLNQNGFIVPKGFFEYKLMSKFEEIMQKIEENNRLHWQLNILKKIANCCGCKAFFVGYSYKESDLFFQQLDKIKVFNINYWQKGAKMIIHEMTEEQYKDFLKKL